MPQLNLKPTHKTIRNYYATLRQYNKHNITHEGAVSNPFALLRLLIIGWAIGRRWSGLLTSIVSR